jgi:hypothetical protein
VNMACCDFEMDPTQEQYEMLYKSR